MVHLINPLPPSVAVRKQKKNYVIGPFFGQYCHQFKKYNSSRNMKLSNLGISRSVKYYNLIGKIVLIPLKLNFTRNTSGCYG